MSKSNKLFKRYKRPHIKHTETIHTDTTFSFFESSILQRIVTIWREYGPVSYTHLDVYKRQSHNGAALKNSLQGLKKVLYKS